MWSPGRKRSDHRHSAEVAACHGQRDAGDVRGFVRGQEEDCRGLLVRRAEALHQAGEEGLIHDLLVPDLLLFGRRSGVARDAPRATPQMRMPCSAYSTARQAVMAFTPPFAAA